VLFFRRLRVLIVGRRRQVALSPSPFPSTKKFTNDVIGETQVCDIPRDSRQLNDATVEAILDKFGMPEIHPMDEKVE